MRKQELIHMHGLLAEVAEYCSEHSTAPELEEYNSLETRPTSIHRSKTDHKEAVFALTEGLTSSLGEETEVPVQTDSPVSAD